ncbi:MAG: hypothetical protein KF771_05850 [Burkholderiales bacterium]|nr:hypothetical protein [Burkholderiales bacterium]
MNILLVLLLVYFGIVALWAGIRLGRTLRERLRQTFAEAGHSCGTATIEATMPPRRSACRD